MDPSHQDDVFASSPARRLRSSAFVAVFRVNRAQAVRFLPSDRTFQTVRLSFRAERGISLCASTSKTKTSEGFLVGPENGPPRNDNATIGNQMVILVARLFRGGAFCSSAQKTPPLKRRAAAIFQSLAARAALKYETIRFRKLLLRAVGQALHGDPLRRRVRLRPGSQRGAPSSDPRGRAIFRTSSRLLAAQPQSPHRASRRASPTAALSRRAKPREIHVEPALPAGRAPPLPPRRIPAAKALAGRCRWRIQCPW